MMESTSPVLLTECLEEWLADAEHKWVESRDREPRQLRAFAKRLVKDAEALDEIYAQMSDYWRRRFDTPPSDVLRKQADIITSAASAMRPGGLSSPALATLQEHLVLRTGRRHDREIAELLTRIHSRKLKVTIKSLEQLAAAAEKRRAREMPKDVARHAAVFGGQIEQRRRRRAADR
jgi:hypothetical protein